MYCKHCFSVLLYLKNIIEEKTNRSEFPWCMVVPGFRKIVKSKFSINSNIQNLILPVQKTTIFLAVEAYQFF